MKKSSNFLKALLSVSLLFQGLTLAAACAAPCHMGEAAMLRCVMGDLLEREQAPSGVQPYAEIGQGKCGHLEFHNQIPTVGIAIVKLAKAPSEQIFAFVPSVATASKAVFEGIDTRAGPLEPGSGQALLSVPPQNAPPVLV